MGASEDLVLSEATAEVLHMAPKLFGRTGGEIPIAHHGSVSQSADLLANTPNGYGA